MNRRHRQENRYTQTLVTDFHLPLVSQQIRRLELRITENISYLPELPAFSFGQGGAQQDNQGIQVGRTDTFRNHAGIVLGYAWTPLFSTALSYSHLITRYRGSEVLQGYDVHEGTLSGNYQVSRRMQWTVSYLASVTDYQRADSVAVHRFNVGDFYQISPTVTTRVGTGVAITARVGTLWTVNADIEKSDSSGTLSLQYSRGIGTGGGLTTTATLTQNVIAQVRRNLVRSLSASFHVGYGVNETLSGPPLKIFTQEIGTGIQMSLLSWLSGEVNYSYLNQRTEGRPTIQDARRNQAMVILTATALPIRIME